MGTMVRPGARPAVATGARCGGKKVRGGKVRRDLSIRIVGGSLVGPVAALLLGKADFADIVVYEELPEALSRSGGIMGLRFPTIDVLKSVGIDKRDIVALRDNNTYHYDLSKNSVPVVRSTSDFPGIVTSWDALHDKLKAAVKIRYGHRVTGYGGGVLHIEGPDGSIAERPDLVIFADGRKSTGREILDPNRPLRYQGYAVWRGLVQPPWPEPTGFNRYFDPDASRLFSITGPVLQSGRSYWELSHNLHREVWEQVAGGRPEDRAYLLPQVVERQPDAKDVIRRAMRHLPDAFQSLVASSEISGIPVNDTRMPDRAAFQSGDSWAVLVGDALIPVRLQVGAGLNQGLIEVALLVDYLASRDDMRDIMHDWEAQTLDAMGRWVELGRSRVSRINLGRYQAVRPGLTAVPPSGSPWDEPVWVTA